MKHAAHLPQLRPVPRRPGRGRQRDGEQSEDGGGRQNCFGGPFFGGCTLCAVDDDDFRPRGFSRLRSTWVSLDDGFCATSDKTKAGVTELIEEAEGSTVGGEDSSEEDESSGDESSQPRRLAKAVPSVPSNRAGSQCRARSADEECLYRELQAVMWSAGDVFAAKGWELSHVSGERYRLNGRTIKLSLLPAGAPLPYFTHIAPATGYDVAERASRITVCDGPLRQPLLDYLMQTGQNENYDQRGTENAAGVAGAGRYLDFNVAFSGDRMIEMKHATIQAEMRRRVGGGDATRMTALQEEGGRLLGGKAGGSALSRGPSSNTYASTSFPDTEGSRRCASAHELPA